MKHWVVTEEDARRLLSMPYAPPRPDLTYFVDTARRLGGTVAPQVTLNDPICWIGGIVEPATLALWTVENRPLVREMLDVAFRRTMDLLDYLLPTEVGPIYYFNGPEYALPPLMAPRDFDEFVVAYDQPLVRRIHAQPDRYVIFHSHGRVSRFLERFAEIGIDGLNVLEPPPMGDTLLADAKRRIGDRVCLIGNIQYDDLARSTPEEVDRLVRQALADGAPGGGFILSPCASPYESPLPPRAADNLITYLHAGHKHGQYK